MQPNDDVGMNGQSLGGCPTLEFARKSSIRRRNRRSRQSGSHLVQPTIEAAFVDSRSCSAAACPR
jgi:hypothetical protein